MKYIIVKSQHDGRETPIIFDDKLVHSFIAKGATYRNGHSVVSAGFLDRDEKGQWFAYGESESIEIKSREVDSFIINSYLNTT